jgi:hypothetical protein
MQYSTINQARLVLVLVAPIVILVMSSNIAVSYARYRYLILKEIN